MPDFVADTHPVRLFHTGGIEWQKTLHPTKAPKEIPAGSFNMRVGNTTYIVGVHFSKESKDTLEDKVKRLMREDVKAANF